LVRRYSVTIAGRARLVEIEEGEAGEVRVSVDGQERRITLRRGAGGALTWFDGNRVVRAFVDGAPPKTTVVVRGAVIPAEVADARSLALGQFVRQRPKAAGPAAIRAPIPGRVAKVLVKPGEAVSVGRGLVVLEAMKMENEIRAPRDGSVREIRCAEGQAVESNQDLIVLD
jgi:biotin carboxyl carrier protein